MLTKRSNFLTVLVRLRGCDGSLIELTFRICLFYFIRNDDYLRKAKIPIDISIVEHLLETSPQS